VGSEVIGLIPEACMLEAGRFALENDKATTNECVQAAIDYLGLNKLKPFDPEEKILERALAKHNNAGKNEL
jgi:glutamate formiminotransferase/formiminotetrahydrofolate cyclodeaminase